MDSPTDPSPFGALMGRMLPRPTRPLPLPENVEPGSYEAARVFGRGFRGLSPFAQEAVAVSGPVRAVFNEAPSGSAGGVAGRGQVMVWFPRGEGSVPVPWGDVTADTMARHELAHVAYQPLGGIGVPRQWRDAAMALRAYGERNPEFAGRMRRAHPDTEWLFERSSGGKSLSDVVRSRQSSEEDRKLWYGLQEYMASRMEGGNRMPVPSDDWLKNLGVVSAILGASR